MVLCLTSARFTFQADILRQGYVANSAFDPTDQTGEWINQQDEESGDIIRIWQPKDSVDDVGTEGVYEGLVSFPCEARGIIDGGIRVTGSTERFGDSYENVDYVKLTFPSNVDVSKRDRITNIRDSNGNVIWKEREQPGHPPTVYEVTGITPIIAPFVGHVENFALLKRAERQ